MTQDVVKEPLAEKRSWRVLWLYVLLAAIPVALIVLYYIYNSRQDIMDWVNTYISSPYRSAAATVTSLGPLKFFSLAEVLITLLILWALYYIIKSIIILITRPQRFLHLCKRVYVMLVVALYLFAAYSWTWGTGYHSMDLADKIGFSADGVTVQQLTSAAEHFTVKANELSGQVSRDADGHFIVDTNYYFELSKGLYTNIASEFPALAGKSYPPKAMMYSKLMSMAGFTGVYISLTGETNINVDAPAAFVPATIAHEMAHQRGVNSEDEANFAGITACITSNISVFEYSGYLSGLIYLTNALNEANPDAASEVMAAFSEDVIRDWTDNIDYWSRYESPAAEVVSAMYDGYLKSNAQELGISSYGACVNLLVTWLEEIPQT